MVDRQRPTGAGELMPEQRSKYVDEPLTAAEQQAVKSTYQDIPALAPRTWTDTAVDALPAVGGMVGGALGSLSGIPTLGLGAVPGAITGATVLGGGGEAARQLINRVRGRDAPSTPTEAATSIGLQGGA